MTLKTLHTVVCAVEYTIVVSYANGRFERLEVDYLAPTGENGILRMLQLEKLKNRVQFVTVNSATGKLEITVDILEQDSTDDPRYIRSAAAGDYSPSAPWNAPGMSVSDFVR